MPNQNAIIWRTDLEKLLEKGQRLSHSREWYVVILDELRKNKKFSVRVEGGLKDVDNGDTMVSRIRSQRLTRVKLRCVYFVGMHRHLPHLDRHGVAVSYANRVDGVIICRYSMHVMS